MWRLQQSGAEGDALLPEGFRSKAQGESQAGRFCYWTAVVLGLKQVAGSKANWLGMSIFSVCPTMSQARVSPDGVFIT